MKSTNSKSGPLTGSKNVPAVFSSPHSTYHADRCEALRAAVRRGEVRLCAHVHGGYPGRLMPADVLAEVSTVGFWDATGSQTWGLDWHRNEGIELTYLASGMTDFLVEEKTYNLRSGHLTITRPWQQHRVGNPLIGPSRLCWLILDVGVRRPDQKWQWPSWMILSQADLDRLTKLLSQNEHTVWRANDEIAACFEHLSTLVQSKHPLKVQSRLQLYINELFIALRELLEEHKLELDAHLTSTRRTVELFLSTLPENLKEEWTLDKMAYQCGLGATAFTNYCRQITNMTPSKYLVQCRVEVAKKMLLNHPQMSVTQIALECGFQTSQYFATVFLNRTHLSPRAWRMKVVGPA